MALCILYNQIFLLQIIRPKKGCCNRPPLQHPFYVFVTPNDLLCIAIILLVKNVKSWHSSTSNTIGSKLFGINN